MTIGKVLVRGVVGPLFVGHGTQKLFGWFGGHGLDGTAGFFESLGLRPGREHAIAAGISETLGGVLVTLGAFTPLGATLVSGPMFTAIRKVHASNGPWAANGGYEYNLVVIAAMAALAESGPGSLSVDRVRFPDFKGTTWAVLAIGAAAAGSYAGTSDLLNEGAAGPQEGSFQAAGDPATIDEPAPPASS